MSSAAPDVDSRIEIHAGDIAALAVDAIVNAANEKLAPGGGVCGAIHRAAGPELAAECAARGGCPTGGAVLTPGFALPARFVIHAVGPVWRGGEAGEPEALAGCYRASLACLREAGGRSIAFPAISTGIYGFPLERATAIAVETVRAALAAAPEVERAIFCVFGRDAEATYRRALGREF